MFIARFVDRFDDDAIAMDLNDLDAGTGVEEAALRDDVEDILAKLAAPTGS